MDFCVKDCVAPCCTSICKDAPSIVQGGGALIVSITLLVIGILGACAVIQMSPGVAYSNIAMSLVFFFLGCLACCCEKEQRRTFR